MTEKLDGSLRKLSAKGLIPLSLFAAIISGNPTVSAQETTNTTLTPPGLYSKTEDENKETLVEESSSRPIFGAKLYTPDVFNHYNGMWVGRSLSENHQQKINSPQLHEFFLTDGDILLKTTVKNTGVTTMNINTSKKLPEKVASSLRQGMKSMPADMVFSHFS